MKKHFLIEKELELYRYCDLKPGDLTPPSKNWTIKDSYITCKKCLKYIENMTNEIHQKRKLQIKQ